MKPIKDLTDVDILTMTEAEFRQYEIESKGEIDCLKMASVSKKQKFHELADILKQRGIDYKEYQKEAYEIRREYQTLLKQVIEEEGYFVRLLRDWNKVHGKNQVMKWTKSEVGRDILTL